MKHTLKKSERLCRDQYITQLYNKGNRGFTRFPFRFTWIVMQNESPAGIELLVGVSKRKIALATNRNKVKRIIRELYRLHKNPLEEATARRNIRIALAINFIPNAPMDYAKIQPTFELAIKQLVHELEKHL